MKTEIAKNETETDKMKLKQIKREQPIKKRELKHIL
jgi:hypothetical protein